MKKLVLLLFFASVSKLLLAEGCGCDTKAYLYPSMEPIQKNYYKITVYEGDSVLLVPDCYGHCGETGEMCFGYWAFGDVYYEPDSTLEIFTLILDEYEGQVTPIKRAGGACVTPFTGIRIIRVPRNNTIQLGISGVMPLQAQPFKFNIYDIHGSIVASGDANNESSINTSTLPSGIYIIHIETSEGVIRRKIFQP